jgi:hypothetical protein
MQVMRMRLLIWQKNKCLESWIAYFEELLNADPECESLCQIITAVDMATLDFGEVL